METETVPKLSQGAGMTREESAGWSVKLFAYQLRHRHRGRKRRKAAEV